MNSFFQHQNLLLLALFGGCFTFIFTMFGSMLVFFFKKVNNRVMNTMMSISAGIMMAASIFSLLVPAIDISKKMNQNLLLSIGFGIIIGSIFIFVSNKIIDRIYSEKGHIINIRRCILLFISITLHNIPEGLVIGVAFGNCIYGGKLIAAISLSFGIAIQNFPEGAAISLPLRREGISRFKSFLFGTLSGIVEPIFSLVGALIVLRINYILPFILSFAASAMIYVTVLELIPESQTDKKKDLMALLFIIGFLIMMLLDIYLG